MRETADSARTYYSRRSAKLILCSTGESRKLVGISVTYANGSGSIEDQEDAEARRWAASAHPHDPGRPCKKLAEQQADASPSNTATVPPAGLHRRNLILIALSCAADTDVCVRRIVQDIHLVVNDLSSVCGVLRGAMRAVVHVLGWL